MKRNTQKILLSLYPSGRVKLNNLKIVSPELTDGGRRSLIHVLKARGLINSEKVLGVSSVGITQHGIDAIEAEFPALLSKWDAWQDNWDCLVFVKSSKSDKQFRYLRSILVSEGAISITRGVYVSPISFSERVVRECKEIYRDYILMFSVGIWKIASLRSLVIEKYGLIDIAESYSGISRDVSRLLETVDIKHIAMHRNTIDINLVFDRLIDVLSEDPGFCKHYFDQVPRVKNILSDLSSMVSGY